MRVLRLFGLWVLPFIVTALMLLLGFAYWCAASQLGTRWLLRTAAAQMDGVAQGVHGTLRDGLYVEGLSLAVPGADVRIVGLHLKVLWSELLERRVHVDDLSAVRIDVALRSAPEDDAPAGEPFRMPVLPVDVQVDRLALGGLGLTIDGEAPPVELLSVSTALMLDRRAASVRLDHLQAAWGRMLLSLDGRLAANGLEPPWPLTLDLRGFAQDRSADSPLCLRRYLGRRAADAGSSPSPDCRIDLGLRVAGSLDSLTAALRAKGEGLALDAEADVLPNHPFPLARARLSASLPDGSKASLRVEPEADDAPAGRAGVGSAAAGSAVADGVATGDAPAGDAAARDAAAGDAAVDRAAADGAGDGAGDDAAAGGAATGDAGAAAARTLAVSLAMSGFDPGPWLPDGLGASLLNLEGTARIGLDASHAVRELGLKLAFGQGSRWNGQPLSGSVAVGRAGMRAGPLFDARADGGFDPAGLVVSGLDADLALGPDRLRARGEFSLARTALDLQAQVPALAALWPGLPGGASLHATLEGSLAQQRLALEAGYTPEDAREGVLGHAPVDARLRLDGGWAEGRGWRGTLGALDVSHAGLSLHSETAVPLELDPPAAPVPPPAGPAASTGAEAGAAPAARPDGSAPARAPGWAWKVGAARLEVGLEGEELLRLDHGASSGSGHRWASSGRIDPLVITPERIQKLQDWLARGGRNVGGVNTALSERARRSRLESRLDWSLSFDDALSGDVRLTRTGGDLVVPGDVPIELGLREAALAVSIKRRAAGLSQVEADLRVATAKMGSMRVRAGSPLHATPGGGLGLKPQDTKTVHIEAVSEDLAWINLFLDGGIEVGGTIHADIEGRSLPDGRWTLSGPLSGENISLLSADQGVRLLDGTLRAHFEGERVTLDALRFPAVRRVTPKEWRTATWISEEPDAQNGSLTLSGQWDLFRQGGGVDIVFHRYPILQRADRYAMISGTLRIDSVLPKLGIRGRVEADAGWFDLDMLSNIPALDGDVVVLEPGKEPVLEEPAPPLDIDMDLSVGLGPRFYITGYGVNSGLVGDLELRMSGGKLTGIGVLRTRGGSLDAYGQHLQLRRGTITFQGDIANPVIGIEALRTDAAVRAGVRVAGTARRPRIDLVSYPDVSETEKLTWLLLGHGPDESGGDMALLFSVGSSFLSSGEPFYQRFGLDELSMRSGELGSTGSILPIETVVSSQDTSSASDIERRFIVAGKTISRDLRASLEQALSQTGTVARLSYRLMSGLRAELTVGTVNGLALVYRWFSMD